MFCKDIILVNVVMYCLQEYILVEIVCNMIDVAEIVYCDLPFAKEVVDMFVNNNMNLLRIW